MSCSCLYLTFVTVKYLSVLLALVVLILSIQPVCAGIIRTGSCCTENICTEENENKERDAHSGKECANGCNPFQICGCCAFSVVPMQVPVLMNTAQAVFRVASWAGLDCRYAEAPVRGLWQPPEFS